MFRYVAYCYVWYLSIGRDSSSIEVTEKGNIHTSANLRKYNTIIIKYFTCIYLYFYFEIKNKTIYLVRSSSFFQKLSNLYSC